MPSKTTATIEEKPMKAAKTSARTKKAKAEGETAEKTVKVAKPKKPAARTKKAKAEGTAAIEEKAAETTKTKKKTAKKSKEDAPRLVIVESPAKAKTISKYLGKNYRVTASMGHIRDLPSSSLGIDIENNYTPKYITIKGKNALVKELKSLAKKSGGVLLATDPDREGEAISWHLANVLGLDPAEPNRVTFDEITKKGVSEGMANPRAIDMNLFNAQQARRELDRLVGYKLSPFLWRKVRRGLSAGRVQSVAVRLIRDRELEIERFQPDEYWNLDATLKAADGGIFTARLSATADGKKLTVSNKEQADGILAALDGKTYTVTKLEKGQRRRSPLPPFITSTLQQEASSRFGFSATRTMRAAQTLYEGMDIEGHGTVGLITYMRTDSLRLSDEAVAAAKEFIKQRWGEQYCVNTKRKWKSRSATAAQDAHEAIRPSIPELTPDEVERSISGDTAKLYRLIWSRFMASQMADSLQDTVSATITAGNYLFRASGFHVAFDGYTALYEVVTDEKQKKETALPDLTEGETPELQKLSAEQKFTQPPPLYTEAALIHALEENGIGRPSTYAPTITTIVDRGYVEKEQKKLKTTPLGQAVNTVMLEQFPDIVDPTFSAEMEKKLDVVENGEADWVKTIDEFYKGFSASLETAEKNMEGKKIKVEDIPTDEICPLCGKPMVIKTGRFGKFVACSGFPDCRNSHPLVKDTGGICPLCGGHLVVKKSSKGRVFYGCAKYPECNFVSWDEPVAETCPNCGKTLFKKKGELYCATEGCGFTKPIEKK